MTSILFLGYGNPDRQDDGVAWHILRGVAERLGLPVPDTYYDEFPALESPERETVPGFLFVLQLTPELAETVARCDVVCFVDAHTGRVEQDLNFAPLAGEYQSSSFTHHLTPQTCLALSGALYGITPRGFLLSVRGYEFGFDTGLSEATRRLADQAVDRLEAWLKDVNLTGDNSRIPR